MKTTRTLIAGAAAMLLAAPVFAQQEDPSTQPGRASADTAAHGDMNSTAASQQSIQAMQKDPQWVRQVQQKLQDQGYDVGGIDGKWGPKSSAALKEFQRAQGMQADGRLSQDAVTALGLDMQGSDSMATREGQTGGDATGAADSMSSPQDATGAMDDPNRGAGGSPGTAGTGAGASTGSSGAGSTGAGSTGGAGR